MWGSVLHIVNNNKGDDSRAPCSLRPLGGIRPTPGLRPLYGLGVPTSREDLFVLVLLVGELVQPVQFLPTFYLRDRSLGGFRRRKPRLLGLPAVLLRSLAALSLPRTIRFLLLFSLFLFLVPGPVLGLELLVLRNWGHGVLDDPHPLQTNR